MLTIIVFLFILTILVLVHELGHFLAAKRFGIKVEEFGVGLPPRLFGIKRGETLYSINWLPLGGFVKLYGEDDPGVAALKRGSPGASRSFTHRPAHQRAAIAVAGVVMNLLLAVPLFYGALSLVDFTAKVPLLVDHQFRFVNQKNVYQVIIADVAEGSPAKQVGMRPGSRVVSVNGIPFSVDVASFKEYIDARRGSEIQFELEDISNRQRYTVYAVPRVLPPLGEGALGISLTDYVEAHLSYNEPFMKAFSGFSHTLNMAEYNLLVLGRVVGVAIERRTAAPVTETVGGPVAIGSIISGILAIPDVAQRLMTLLTITALISISLSIVNILPFPALDGGRLFLILIETVTRRRIDPTIERHINTIGFIILITLMLLITYRDLLRFVFVQ